MIHPLSGVFKKKVCQTRLIVYAAISLLILCCLILSRLQLVMCFRGSFAPWGTHRLNLDLSKIKVVMIPSLLPVII